MESIETDPIQFIDLDAQKQKIGKHIQSAMNEVLNHHGFVNGPEVTTLESALKDYTGAKHAITCASGTDALKLLLMAHHLKDNDCVFIPSFTFAATAEMVAENHGVPYFVDVESDSFNIDPQDLEACILDAKKQNLNPRGIIAVDLFGLPANYQALEGIAQKHGLFLIADSAQSFGAVYHGKRAGAITSMTATSFFPSKPLACYGDGGALFVENDEIASLIRSLKSHGTGEDRYTYEYIGINSRLDTLQAAILLEKLKIFEEEFSRRQQIAAFYEKNLKDVVQVPKVPAEVQSAWGLYTLKCEPSQRDGLIALLKAENIPAVVYYKKPLHSQKAYQAFPHSPQGMKITNQLKDEVVSIPMHPYLSDQQLQKICHVILHALK